MSQLPPPLAPPPQAWPHPLGSRAARVALALAVLAYALAFQGSRGIWEPDEGRYTDIATQMLRSGDFVTPAFNDEVPHFAKPPLVYWAIAGGITVLGWNEWGARLPNALAFTVTIVAVIALGRRVTPRRPWLPALIYATFLVPAIAANAVTTDTLLTMWATLGVLCFVLFWERRDTPRWRPPLLATWVCFSLAFLTKGPPGLLPLLAIGAFAALAGGRRAFGRLICPGGVAAFLVVGLGWYIAVSWTHPGLLTYFLHDELVSRVATTIHHRNPQWYGGLWVYGPTLLIGSLPWTWPLLRGLGRSRATLLSRAWWRATLAADPWVVFVALWFLLPLGVFFVSRSRLPLYALPLFAPLALLAARALRTDLGSRRAAALAAAWAVLLLGIRWGAARIPSPNDSRALAQEVRALAPKQPNEVVFIDSDAVWGLALYLRGAEVENVYTGTPPPGGGFAGREHLTLREELAEREPGALMLVAAPSLDAVRAELARAGRSFRELGRLRRWTALAVD